MGKWFPLISLALVLAVVASSCDLIDTDVPPVAAPSTESTGTPSISTQTPKSETPATTSPSEPSQSSLLADKVIELASGQIGTTQGAGAFSGLVWADSQFTYCDRFISSVVTLALGMSLSDRKGYEDALKDYAAHKHLIRHGNPPRGAIVYYSGAQANAELGHVGIADGSGNLISVINRTDGVKRAGLDQMAAPILGWIYPSEYYSISPISITSVTLTLFVHEGNINGPVISEAQVTGQDGRGNSFSQVTNSNGFVNITGVPGTWSFTASKNSYDTNSWQMDITTTDTKHAYLEVPNPTSFSSHFDLRDMLGFSDDIISAEDIVAYIQQKIPSSPMLGEKNIGDIFINAGFGNNVNPAFLVATAYLEGRFGTQGWAESHPESHNTMGWGIPSGDTLPNSVNSANSWGDMINRVAYGIAHGAYYYKVNLFSVEQVRNKYATQPNTQSIVSTMNELLNFGTTFQKITEYTLTISSSGSGSTNPSSGAYTYASRTPVTLTATPASGWQFSGWSGDFTGSQNPATITMNSNKSVTAIFIQQNTTPSPPTIVDVGIASRPYYPQTFLQARQGDTIYTFYTLSYLGPDILINFKTTILYANGNETGNQVSDPGYWITEELGKEPIAIGFQIPDDTIPGTYDVKFSIWNKDNTQQYDSVLKSGWLEIVPTADTTKPQVDSFSVAPNSVSLGSSFIVSYGVSDSGGFGLKQVELWRAPDSGGSPGTWAQLQTKSASGSSGSGSFTDTPSSAGTYWYGVHVVDNAGNWAAESSPAQRMVNPAADTIKPQVDSFSVTPSSVSLGSSFIVSYGVSDSGGSGLKQVELWRAPDSGGIPGTWAQLQTKSASGNSSSGSFTDAPSSTGTYWYGVHVVDNAGNWAAEGSPAQRAVNPSLSFTSLTPGTVSTSQSTYVETFNAVGTNFNNINQITVSWSGPDSGSQTWNKGDSNWNAAITVNSNTSMTLLIRVLYNETGTQSKTWNWTVTLKDATSVTASKSFTVTYTPATTSLSLTSLVPSTITTSTAPYDATLSAAGANFNNVNQVAFSWSGAVSGSATWNKGDSSWNSKVTVNSDTSMTLMPRVVETSPPWSGTVTWTVTLRDPTGATALKFFTVTYTAPTGGITIGSSVRATANVNCRSSPTTSGSIIKTMPSGSTGTVIRGPVAADGYVWWQIRWSDGTTGWSVQDYIAKT
jgi:hypothetical protein